jgi:hypothetical protein
LVRSRERARIFVTCLAVTCVTGCGLVLGLESLEYEPTLDGSVDGTGDALVERADGGSESSTGPSLPDAEAPFDLPARWTSYKPPGTSGATYQAGPYDGRFAYFLLNVPTGNASAVVRYDTEAPFDAPESWATFPVVGVADVSAHRALAFDGRYLTLPGTRTLDAGTLTGVSLRFDTQRPADFLSPSAWEVFDTKPFTDGGVGYPAAATIDGGLYLGSSSANIFPMHHAPLAAPDAGWEQAGVTNTTGGNVLGAGCTGPFLYFIGQAALRYDLRKPFGDPTAWEGMALSAFGPDHAGYTGTISTPSHVYTSQASAPADGGDRKWRVARTSPTDVLDAGFEFREVAKTNPLATGALGGAFDGRYVYFAPFPRGTPLPGTVYLRYDTQQPFDADSAWASVTGTALGFGVYSHRGAVFDGMYVYFPPGGTNVPFVRYRATDVKSAFTQPCSPF